MGHVVARMSKLRMAQCFSQWEHALVLWASESNAERQAESMALLRSELVAQQQKAAAGVLRRWRQRHVAKCLASWEAWTAAAQQRRHAMSQVQRRVRHSRVFSALNTWHLRASSSARAKRVIVGIMRRANRRRVAVTFESWADMVSRKHSVARVLLKTGVRRDLLLCRVVLDDWVTWLRWHRSLTIR